MVTACCTPQLGQQSQLLVTVYINVICISIWYIPGIQTLLPGDPNFHYQIHHLGTLKQQSLWPRNGVYVTQGAKLQNGVYFATFEEIDCSRLFSHFFVPEILAISGYSKISWVTHQNILATVFRVKTTPVNTRVVYMISFLSDWLIKLSALCMLIYIFFGNH